MKITVNEAAPAQVTVKAAADFADTSFSLRSNPDIVVQIVGTAKLFDGTEGFVLSNKRFVSQANFGRSYELADIRTQDDSDIEAYAQAFAARIRVEVQKDGWKVGKLNPWSSYAGMGGYSFECRKDEFRDDWNAATEKSALLVTGSRWDADDSWVGKKHNRLKLDKLRQWGTPDEAAEEYIRIYGVDIPFNR